MSDGRNILRFGSSVGVCLSLSLSLSLFIRDRSTAETLEWTPADSIIGQFTIVFGWPKAAKISLKIDFFLSLELGGALTTYSWITPEKIFSLWGAPAPTAHPGYAYAGDCIVARLDRLFALPFTFPLFPQSVFDLKPLDRGGPNSRFARVALSSGCGKNS